MILHVLVGMLSGAPLVDGARPAVDPYAGPKPVAVWIETNPWAMVMGADTPRLTIYEDGSVICLEASGAGPSRYVTTKLPPEQMERVRKQVAALGSFAGVKDRYMVARVTDRPTARLYLDLGGGAPMVTQVYGLVAGEAARGTSPGSRPSDAPPASVMSLHRYLADFRCEGSATWTPGHIEVMLWPYEYAPEQSTTWPPEWPGLDSPEARARGESHSIYLPGTKLTELQQLLGRMNPKGALEVGGKKWAVSYRFVFPSEPIWFEAFRRE